MRVPFRALLARRLNRLAADEGGAAAVEFALILPFLLLLYMGSIEASTLITVDRRVEVISSTVADLVARWNPNQGASIPKSTLLDYFKASEGIIVPYPTTDLKQVVSFVQVSAAGVGKVVWSCSYNGGAALAKDANFAVAENMADLVTGEGAGSGYLIASKVDYPYLPVFGLVFQTAVPMQNESQFLPRFGTALAAPSGTATLTCNG